MNDLVNRTIKDISHDGIDLILGFLGSSLSRIMDLVKNESNRFSDILKEKVDKKLDENLSKKDTKT